jgi:DNA-binding transcriptional ArsR family regulator
MKEKDFEKIFKALANRRRLAIIRYLKKRKSATVGSVAGEIKLSFKSTSKHLNILFAADLVDREQRDLQKFYSLSDSLPDFIKPVILIL